MEHGDRAPRLDRSPSLELTWLDHEAFPTVNAGADLTVSEGSAVSLGGSFSDPGFIDCTGPTNQCGKDFIESRARLGVGSPTSRHAECTDCHNPHRVVKFRSFVGNAGSISGPQPVPTESDLVFARTAASDVLTKGDKDSSQPWENPSTGARGSVTPLANAYADNDGRTCRDFLASYVNGRSESWMQGAACKAGHGRWEIHTLKPWKRG